MIINTGKHIFFSLVCPVLLFRIENFFLQDLFLATICEWQMNKTNPLFIVFLFTAQRSTFKRLACVCVCLESLVFRKIFVSFLFPLVLTILKTRVFFVFFFFFRSSFTWRFYVFYFIFPFRFCQVIYQHTPKLSNDFK